MTRPTAFDGLRALSSVLCLLFLGLTVGPAAAQTSNPASDRAAIEELSRQFSAAYMRGDAAAMGEPEGWRMHLDMWNLRPQPKP